MCTKLHISVHKYGGETKFSAKLKNNLKQSITWRDFFLQLTVKLIDNWMNALH